MTRPEGIEGGPDESDVRFFDDTSIELGQLDEVFMTAASNVGFEIDPEVLALSPEEKLELGSMGDSAPICAKVTDTYTAWCGLSQVGEAECVIRLTMVGAAHWPVILSTYKLAEESGGHIDDRRRVPWGDTISRSIDGPVEDLTDLLTADLRLALQDPQRFLQSVTS